MQLRLTPDHPSPVPTSWAYAVSAGARAHRRLQNAVRDVSNHLQPRPKRGRKHPPMNDVQRAAAETLDAALRADLALSRVAKQPKAERRSAMRNLLIDVEHVEQLASRTARRASRDDGGNIVTSTIIERPVDADSSTAVVRLDP